MEPKDRLQDWIENQRMKPTDLARRMDVSDALVSLILNGVRPPSGDFKWRFQQCFGYDAAQAVFNGDCQEQAA